MCVREKTKLEEGQGKKEGSVAEQEKFNNLLRGLLLFVLSPTVKEREGKFL
jgi:hypothetical protein